MERVSSTVTYIHNPGEEGTAQHVGPHVSCTEEQGK